MGFSIDRMNDYVAVLRGVAAEPIEVTEESCRAALARLFGRKGSLSPEEYSRKKAPYMEVLRLMDWKYDDPDGAPVEPEVTAPPEQAGAVLARAFAEPIEPAKPKFRIVAKETWADRMARENP